MTPRIIPVESFDLVVFGATGDLAQRKLLPALFHRDLQGQIPPGARIIGASRRAMSNEEFHGFAEAAIKAHVPADQLAGDVMARFLARLSYVSVDASRDADWDDLAAALGETGDRIRVFYLAVGPDLFGPICERLGSHGLVTPQTRVVIEKPLGKTGASARAVNDAIGKVFSEQQIYRIDHYLGKETVQNLMALRFANALFEPLWNSAHIDHVQITVAETLGVEGRAGYYDTAGALRDMVQNHMLQLLCLVAMEPPASVDANAVRDEKLKVLQALKPITRRCRGAAHRARPVSRRRLGRRRGDGLSGGARRSTTSQDRDLRRHQGRDRELALGRRALLSAHRQAPCRRACRRSSSTFKPMPHSIFGTAAGPVMPNQPGHPPAAGRGRQAVADDQGSRPGRHAPVACAARHELRRGLRRAQSGCL